MPDLRGRAIAGKDNMGGTAANRITTGGSGIDGSSLGAAGGSQTHTLTIAQMPAHSHSQRFEVIANRGSGLNDWYSVGGNTTNGATTASTGGGSAHPITQPTMIMNYIIKK